MRKQSIEIEMHMLDTLQYIQIEAVYQRFDAIVVVSSVQKSDMSRSSFISRNAVDVEVLETASDKSLPIVYWVLNASDDLIRAQPDVWREQLEYYASRTYFSQMERTFSPKQRMLMGFFSHPADKAICLFKRTQETSLLNDGSAVVSEAGTGYLNARHTANLG